MSILGLPTYTLVIAIAVAIAAVIISSIVFYEAYSNIVGRVIGYVLYVIGVLAAAASTISLLFMANWNIGNGAAGFGYVIGAIVIMLFWILFPLGCRGAQSSYR